MTYNPSIPQPTDLISTSQGQILANFGQLNSQFSTDHVAFNTGSGNGDGTHKKITFDNAPAAPTPTGTISNMYPSSVSGEQEMMWKNASHTNQITSGGLPIWKGGTVGANGLVGLLNASSNQTNILTLPNGIQFIWGLVSPPVNGNGTVTFPSSGFANMCLNVQLTPAASNNSADRVVKINSQANVGFTLGLAKTGFQYTTTSNTFTQLYYFAIGY